MTEDIFESTTLQPADDAPAPAEDICVVPAEPQETPDEPETIEPDDPETAEDDGPGLPPGMTGDGLRQFLNARHAREISADMRLRAHYERLSRQAGELKARYPGFDLAAEMRDPVFVRLTAPGVDIDPGTAYEIVHRHSLREAQRRADLQRAAEAVRSGSLRPDESALSGVHAAQPVRTDPRNLSADDRRDIRRRVERGERVMF